jgi:ABC-type transporter Mla maintaining outer membrane lipid asymmetry ATPase subunit MlaF
VFNVADHVIMLEGGYVVFTGSVPELKAATDPVIVDFLARYIT